MFSLRTPDRRFDLYAPSADEKALWVHTFKWIIFNNNKSKKDMATSKHDVDLNPT